MTSSPEHRNQKKYPQLWKIVAGAVKSAMDAHEDFVISTPASIVKRVVGQLLTHGVGTELPSVDMDCPDMGISEQGGGTHRYPPPFPLQVFVDHADWVCRARYVLTAHPEYHNTDLEAGYLALAAELAERDTELMRNQIARTFGLTEKEYDW